MKKVAIIGDIHGCFETLKALIKKIREVHPDIELYSVGDLVHRGPHSEKVIEYVMKNFAGVVRGNHEDEFLEQNEMLVNNDQVEFIKSLPYYLDVKDVKDEKGQSLLISHSFLTHCCTVDTIDTDPHWKEKITWNREYFSDEKPRKIRNRFHVFGHTPYKCPPIKEHYANIDTGCCYGRQLTALIFPTKEIFQQELIDKTTKV